MSRITTVFKGYGYTCEFVEAGTIGFPEPALIVTRKKGKGVCFRSEEAREWKKAIETAIDAREAVALCRAIYNG